MAEENKYDLSRPAFEPIEPEPATEEVKEEVKEVEGEQIKNVEQEESEDKPRVPYSHFKKIREEQLAERQRADELEAELERLREERSNREPRRSILSDEPPAYWTRLYGDSPQAKEAWQIEKERQEELRDEIRQETLEALREERVVETQRESQRIQQNLQTIDTQFEDLEAYLGRPISEKEQSEVLDIVDEYTPKDDNGNYLGALISFEKAYEIKELRSKSSNETRKQSRDRVASLTNPESKGEPSPLQVERDKNFNPKAWDAWRKNPLLSQE